MNILCSEEGCVKNKHYTGQISVEKDRKCQGTVFFLNTLPGCYCLGTRKLLYQLICGFDQGYLTVRYQGNISNDTITEKRWKRKGRFINILEGFYYIVVMFCKTQLVAFLYLIYSTFAVKVCKEAFISIYGITLHCVKTMRSKACPTHQRGRHGNHPNRITEES